jgi:hypothetical protein
VTSNGAASAVLDIPNIDRDRAIAKRMDFILSTLV